MKTVMNRNFLRLLPAVLFAVALPTFSPAQAAATMQREASTKVAPEIKAAVLKSMEDIITKGAFVPGVDFGKWPTMLQTKKEDIEKAETEATFTTAVNAALREFGFSHIYLFSPSYAEMRSTSRTVGLGVRVQVEEGGIRVVNVFPGGAAIEAGMQTGDLIIEADGKPVRQPGDLAGEEGSKVSVTAHRGDAKVKFEIVRRKYSTIIPESVRWEKDGVAVVTIPTFDVGYDAANVDRVMAEAKKAKSIVLDLRGNGGGRVTNLLHLSSHFLNPTEPMGVFVSRGVVNRYEKSTGEKGNDLQKVAKWARPDVIPFDGKDAPFGGKVAVLINGATGSASEMLAAALREYRGSKLYGSKSAGAVLASLMRPIDHGFLLQYPVTDYVTVKGLRLEGNGLTVDFEAPVARFSEPDKALIAAVQWVSGA